MTKRQLSPIAVANHDSARTATAALYACHRPEKSPTSPGWRAARAVTMMEPTVAQSELAVIEIESYTAPELMTAMMNVNNEYLLPDSDFRRHT